MTCANHTSWPLGSQIGARAFSADAMKTSHAIRMSSCWLEDGGESGLLGVGLASLEAMVQTAEHAVEQVALGGGVPVSALAAPVVVGSGAG